MRTYEPRNSCGHFYTQDDIETGFSRSSFVRILIRPAAVGEGEDVMEATDSNSRVKGGKRAWHSPKVEQLGNLRDFVKTGNAFGKSVLTTDGESMAGNESMAK